MVLLSVSHRARNAGGISFGSGVASTAASDLPGVVSRAGAFSLVGVVGGCAVTISSTLTGVVTLCLQAVVQNIRAIKPHAAIASVDNSRLFMLGVLSSIAGRKGRRTLGNESSKSMRKGGRCEVILGG